MTIETALERETYIIVSTAHIAASTVAKLPVLPIVCDATEHRFRIPFAPALAEAHRLPPELAALLATLAAAAPQAYGVMIDCDGPLIAGLATFEW